MFTDDLGVTDVNDRGVLLSAKEKLSSLKIEDEATLPRTENDSLIQNVNQPQNITRPSDTNIGEFDDDAGNDNNTNDDEYDDDDDEPVQQLEPISDDEESTIDQQIRWDEEFQANYNVINLSYSGKYNGSSSQEDLTFTDSDDDDEFGKIVMSICRRFKDSQPYCILIFIGTQWFYARQQARAWDGLVTLQSLSYQDWSNPIPLLMPRPKHNTCLRNV